LFDVINFKNYIYNVIHAQHNILHHKHNIHLYITFSKYRKYQHIDHDKVTTYYKIFNVNCVSLDFYIFFMI